MSRKTTLFIAMSEDGFIAGPGDDLSFLNSIQPEGEDFGYADFVAGIDTVIVGRRTYDVVRGMGHPYHEDKEVYVLTRSPEAVGEEGDPPSVHRWDGGMVELLGRLRSEPGLDIYCDGGADVAGQMIAHGLIDELVLTVFPTQLYGGTELFSGGAIPAGFEEVGRKAYHNGLVQFRYLRTWG